MFKLKSDFFIGSPGKPQSWVLNGHKTNSLKALNNLRPLSYPNMFLLCYSLLELAYKPSSRSICYSVRLGFVPGVPPAMVSDWTDYLGHWSTSWAFSQPSRGSDSRWRIHRLNQNSRISNKNYWDIKWYLVGDDM